MVTPGEAIDEYWEYSRIVGGDDGGKTMSPAEYEKYKKEVLPLRLKNRYRQHKTDFKQLPKTRPIKLPCRERNCNCGSYCYIPWSGGDSIRCTCKHTGREHSETADHFCKKEKCTCTNFSSSYTCSCTEPYNMHQMIVETKAEREKRGKPVGHNVPYQAMGGITGFSSLLDGYMRLDESGRGPMDKEVLESEITDQDHPFLRNYAGVIENASEKSKKAHQSKTSNGRQRRQRAKSASVSAKKRTSVSSRHKSVERK